MNGFVSESSNERSVREEHGVIALIGIIINVGKRFEAILCGAEWSQQVAL